MPDGIHRAFFFLIIFVIKFPFSLTASPTNG